MRKSIIYLSFSIVLLFGFILTWTYLLSDDTPQVGETGYYVIDGYIDTSVYQHGTAWSPERTSSEEIAYGLREGYLYKVKKNTPIKVLSSSGYDTATGQKVLYIGTLDGQVEGEVYADYIKKTKAK
ncbi:hypothetical protein KDJ56_00150 [Brevibacillus composti]|uniref:Uncharacterized protein n=1 Tax=Brevibacillus composti TaxID=2796470 RepID=A0A7T5EKW8_9BACL|nr:hypothetical protein [Brevibacillus composti]QQE74486.1 hypothetical protein JD108_00150 [Brevibacillus composti]QUO41568.1 hypothetical protein KDJ56_00150 [Brevibacillus composti]